MRSRRSDRLLTATFQRKFQSRVMPVNCCRTISMNFCRAGTLLSPLQMAESSAVSRKSSTFLSTTLSGFVFAAEVMVNETPIPPATRLSIVVGLFTSCTMFNVRPAAYQKGIAYGFQMGLRPQTLYGIAVSPVGLAGYFLDHDARSYELISRVFEGKSEGLTR